MGFSGTTCFLHLFLQIPIFGLAVGSPPGLSSQAVLRAASVLPVPSIRGGQVTGAGHRGAADGSAGRLMAPSPSRLSGVRVGVVVVQNSSVCCHGRDCACGPET